MRFIVDFPIFIALLSLVSLWLAAQAGTMLRKAMRPPSENEQKDFEIVLAGILTMLGLVIGFGFSMVVNRYDQRQNHEATETNAIGTEYFRTGLFPAAESAQLRQLLREYLEQRILYYEARDEHQLQNIELRTSQLEKDLWSTTQAAVARQPNAVGAVVAVGMNEVFDSRDFTQAAWRNRLPLPAWEILTAMAIFSNFLIGYSSNRSNIRLFLALPLAVCIAFFLIAEIDSPRHGLIRVVPQDLVTLSQSLKSF
jgi:hypothetical protein